MNIFATFKCPRQSARFLDDKRVVKMVLESAQMLCAALHRHKAPAIPYKATHVNHPCTLWAGQTNLNYLWLVEHFQELCTEYTRRYGKTHKCEQYIMYFLHQSQYIPKGFQTQFANCARNKDLGIDLTSEKNVHEAYRKYLGERWKNDKRTPTWYGKAKMENAA